MTEKELEHLLLENLKYNKENNKYLEKIDRRQRFGRNFTVFYWIIIILAAVGGYFYAFPYLQTARETLSEAWQTIVEFTSFPPIQ